MLLEDNILQPKEGAMSLEYMVAIIFAFVNLVLLHFCADFYRVKNLTGIC